MNLDDAVARSAERIAASGHRPRIGVLLGSGWQPFADRARSATRLPYAQLPAFPVLGVAGHAGELRARRMSAAARSRCSPAASTPTKTAMPR